MRRVNCACGGVIQADPADPTDAVAKHNRTWVHRRWRGEAPDRTPVLLEPVGTLDSVSFERMFRVLVDEVRGYVTSAGIVPARKMELSDTHPSEPGGEA